MFQQLDCIALRNVKYNDRNSILTVYTRQHGRLAMLLPASASAESRRLRALCQPLCRFTCMADIRPTRDIYRMRDVKASGTRSAAAPSPPKAAVALFVADFLSAILREPQQDANLYDYLSLSVEALASASSQAVANFHIAFLIHLQHFLGIGPAWSTYSAGAVFDMADGIFRLSPPLHNRFLPSPEAAAAHSMRRMNFRTSRLFRLSRTDRNRILDRLIQYYSIHYPVVGTVASLDVLRTIFSF